MGSPLEEWLTPLLVNCFACAPQRQRLLAKCSKPLRDCPRHPRHSKATPKEPPLQLAPVPSRQND
eukprot:5895206-Amphidinium_carterae.1